MKANKNALVAVLALLDDRSDSRTDKYEQEWNGFWHFFNVMQFDTQFIAVCNTGLDAHTYVALPYEQTNTLAEDASPAGSCGEGWAEIRELLFDDETIIIAHTLEERGISAPDELSYELMNNSGEVAAQIDLAWIGQKIGYMTEDKLSEREIAESAGWNIFMNVDEIKNVFGEE